MLVESHLYNSIVAHEGELRQIKELQSEKHGCSKRSQSLPPLRHRLNVSLLHGLKS